MLRVKALSGSLEGGSYRVQGELVIGRSADADVQLIDKGVSRRHCCLIEDDDGQVVLVDLSANGTLVDGEKVTRVHLLVGKQFMIGTNAFVLEEVAADDRQETEDDLKLASGPADDDTLVASDADIGQLGCGTPLHIMAIKQKWEFCPHCGTKP